MKIYNYDGKSKIFLGVSNAQENPKRNGEYLFPPNSTTIVPPDLKGNEAAVFQGEYWSIVPDYRKQKQINLDTLETSEITEIGKIQTGYMLYSEYLNSEEYQTYLAAKAKEDEYYDILSQISDIDEKRIRAVCEPEIKDKATGETWLDYYNNQIVELREKLQEVEYGT
ncbi:MAG: hypothetical protein LUB59_05625 [Candidatus Gastranaerophilales bacterium]|nr:hypothetical protein [Candidatus Gastranaerophilales bacterium]